MKLMFRVNYPDGTIGWEYENMHVMNWRAAMDRLEDALCETYGAVLQITPVAAVDHTNDFTDVYAWFINGRLIETSLD